MEPVLSEPIKSEDTATAAPAFDAALERIIRRSGRTSNIATAKSLRKRNVTVRQVPCGPVPDDHLPDHPDEPISALFRAAAAARQPAKKWLNFAALSLLTVGCAAGAFLGGVFLGRHGVQASQRPGLLLHSSDSGGTMLIRWNHDAVQNLNEAVVFVNDGGRLINLPLNHSQLLSGQVRYRRKSGSVTATMVGQNLQAVTSFVAHARRRATNPASAAQ